LPLFNKGEAKYIFYEVNSFDGSVPGIDIGFDIIYKGSQGLSEVFQSSFESLSYDNVGTSNEESVISKLRLIYSLRSSSYFDVENGFGSLILFQFPSQGFFHDYIKEGGQWATLP
jgi:hypothetical protein